MYEHDDEPLDAAPHASVGWNADGIKSNLPEPEAVQLARDMTRDTRGDEHTNDAPRWSASTQRRARSDLTSAWRRDGSPLRDDVTGDLFPGERFRYPAYRDGAKGRMLAKRLREGAGSRERRERQAWGVIYGATPDQYCRARPRTAGGDDPRSWSDGAARSRVRPWCDDDDDTSLGAREEYEVFLRRGEDGVVHAYGLRRTYVSRDEKEAYLRCTGIVNRRLIEDGGLDRDERRFRAADRRTHTTKENPNVTRNEYDEIRARLDRIEATCDATAARLGARFPDDERITAAVEKFLERAFDGPTELRDAA